MNQELVLQVCEELFIYDNVPSTSSVITNATTKRKLDAKEPLLHIPACHGLYFVPQRRFDVPPQTNFRMPS